MPFNTECEKFSEQNDGERGLIESDTARKNSARRQTEIRFSAFVTRHFTQISTALDPLHIEAFVWNRKMSVMIP